MRLSTKTKVTFAVALAVSLIGAVASAQNLRVMGTTTGEGPAIFNGGATFNGGALLNSAATFNNAATFNSAATFNNALVLGGSAYVSGFARFANSASVTGEIHMRSPDSTNIYALRLIRTNENSREHQWAWWHMNTGYGQDSLQLWEYHTDSAGGTCGGNTADGAMCNPRLTVAKGGNVGIGVQNAAYRLDVAGDVRATGWLLVNGPMAAGGSEIIFTETAHNHSGRGNPAGLAAIENSRDFGTLMILGRAGTPVGRKVDVWDYLQVNGSVQVSGTIKAAGAVPFYFCPAVTGSCGIDKTCTYCGNFSLSDTCATPTVWPYSRACTLVGRLLNP